MKRLQIGLLIVLTALALGTLRPVRGQSGDFVIENADATNTLAFTGSSALETRMDAAAPRFVMRFANANQVYPLTPIPTALDDLLGAIQARFVMRFANANQFYTLTPIPAQLETLLVQMAPRFVIQYANANRQLALTFPVDLIDDEAPPQASAIETDRAGETSTVFTWTTDEVADSTVEYGTAPGAYTESVHDPLYVKHHRVTLTGLTAGETYYARASSTDRSGNVYRSSEISFEQTEGAFVYLPLVLRR